MKSLANSKLIESVTDFKQKSPATDLLGELTIAAFRQNLGLISTDK
jgi:hypothetical protein